MVIEDVSQPSWIFPITNYVKQETFPFDLIEAHMVKRIVIAYSMIEGTLYRRGISTHMLKWLHTCQSTQKDSRSTFGLPFPSQESP